MEGILTIDVGGGTQDILIYHPGTKMENQVKLVLPSPTQIVARKINKLTEQGKDIFLHGRLMGSGASSSAVKKHLREGQKVYATSQAALTLKDDLEEVTRWGVQVVTSPPENSSPVEFKDIDLPALRQALFPFEVQLPPVFAFAVQDHGFSPHESNRRFRFAHWQKFLSSGGNLADLIYDETTLPDYFTRMEAVMESCRGAAEKIYLMDTGAAAILGALEDPQVREATETKGSMLVNVGNQHTIAFLVAGSRVYGVLEHHTGILSAQKLADYLNRFKNGNLSYQEVFDDHGHGCAVLPEAGNFSFDFVAVTGPQRSMASGAGYLAVPHGDMMISGAFGLAKGVLLKTGKDL